MKNTECRQKKQLQRECLQITLKAAIILSLLSSTSIKVDCAIVGSSLSLNDPRYRHRFVPSDKSADNEFSMNDAQEYDVSISSRTSSSLIITTLTTNKKHTPDTQSLAILHRTKSTPRSSTFDGTTGRNELVFSTSIHRSNENKVTTSCIPEISGYFGATYEAPRVLTYKVEVQYYLTVIEEKSTRLSEGISMVNLFLQRDIIADVFPKICQSLGSNTMMDDYNPKNYSQGRIIGLKFDSGLHIDTTGTLIL
jgi:hypothetical protein